MARQRSDGPGSLPCTRRAARLCFPKGKSASAGFTLVEVALSLVLVGILSLVVSKSASGYLQIFQISHAVSNLSQKEWLASSRIAREVREALPTSFQVDKDGQGFSFRRIEQEGIVEDTDHKKNWIATFAPDTASIPAGARLLLRHKQANKLHETTVTQVVVPKDKGQPCRIYYPSKAPGTDSIQPGDRFWVVGKEVAFRRNGDVLIRETLTESGPGLGTFTGTKPGKGHGNGYAYGHGKSSGKGQGNGYAYGHGKGNGNPGGNQDPFVAGFPLVDTVSRFNVSWKGPGHRLHFELYLSESDIEVGGSYETRPRKI